MRVLPFFSGCCMAFCLLSLSACVEGRDVAHELLYYANDGKTVIHILSEGDHFVICFCLHTGGYTYYSSVSEQYGDGKIKKVSLAHLTPYDYRKNPPSGVVEGKWFRLYAPSYVYDPFGRENTLVCDIRRNRSRQVRRLYIDVSTGGTRYMVDIVQAGR